MKPIKIVSLPVATDGRKPSEWTDEEIDAFAEWFAGEAVDALDSSSSSSE